MAIKESLISVMNKLKEVYTHQVDSLTDDDFYNNPSENNEKLNGMQADDVAEEYGQLDSNKYKSGVHAVSSKSEPHLSAREIEHAELEFQEKIKKFCEAHDYSFKRSLMYENFKITDTAGNEIFTVKSSGDFKYTNADETQFKAMMEISAGQFAKNNKTAFPFVKEDDPSIPNSKQEAILRIAIETLLEHEVPLKRIKIRSKKWAHLMDEYALKQKEEFKQVKPVEIGGVEVGDSGKPEPNKITKIEPFGTIDKFEPEKPVVADKVDEKPAIVTSDEVKKTDGLVLKPVVTKDYTKTLQGELFLAMQNSGGAMFKLLQQADNFAKRNFEINFSKNGELVSVSHIRPVEDGNIHVLTFPLDKLENGLEMKEGVGLYHNRQNQLEEAGNLKSVLKELVSKSDSYVEFKELVEAKKVEGIEIGFTADNRNIHAKRFGEKEEYAQIAVSTVGMGMKLMKDKSAYEKGTFPYDMETAKSFEPESKVKSNLEKLK
ncbi:hypothetical protein [Pseudomonas saxonica]|uniref:Uncharacterized protein n=1 Tax=Pseudomonas saxonica TaxID=2600598 RepID=A0A5C5PZ55_9PSED|nr:hypothetical protein [Pseudomonas saxonica]TWR96341.1 hypothetical protein FJD37_08425 [Pseudomonas saxonica]